MSNSAITLGNCHWIDVHALPTLAEGSKVILFGAGQGSVELLEVNDSLKRPYDVIAISDNDDTMHGKRLRGLEVVPPNDLLKYPDAIILITTISGNFAVPEQLKAMGYSGMGDYFTVGKYPSSCISMMETFLAYNEQFRIAPEGASILHIGPGGFLGLECSLYAMGYNPISMDAYDFGVAYPDVTQTLIQYEQPLTQLLKTSFLPTDRGLLEQRYRSLFRLEAGRTMLNTEKIPYHYPARFSSIPLEDSSVDVVLSNAVLEHVRNPEKAVEEVRRVLKPGGISYQRIITQDHRSMGQMDGYHPWSYLMHDEKEWEKINENKFYQNRLLTNEWHELFEKHMSVLEYKQLVKYAADDNLLSELLACNPQFCRQDFEYLNCDIIAQAS